MLYAVCCAWESRCRLPVRWVLAVGQVRRDLVEAAYTLGASDSGIIRRVLIPATAPDIAEILRLVLGWAWTYVRTTLPARRITRLPRTERFSGSSAKPSPRSA